MKKSRSLPFTLLECLLVLFLLSSVAFVVGMRIKGSQESERFKGAAHALLDRLRLSQELMMLGSDVTLKISHEEGFYRLSLLPMQGSHELKLSLIGKGSRLKGVDRIEFISDEPKMGEDIELAFVSKGCRMPKGTLLLSNRGEEKRIALPGFPSFVRYEGAKPLRQLSYRSEELYPLL